MNLPGEVKAIIGIVLVSLVILIGGVYLLPNSNQNTPSKESTSKAQKVDQKILIREDSYKKVSPNAKVTVVEFLDPECEACGAVYPVVKQILAEYEGRINFVVRYFPLHNNSILAVQSAEAAGRHDKFWEMYSKLFENQKEWAEKEDPQTELFVKYAKEIGLDEEVFRLDIKNKAFEEKANRDKKDGIAAGVQGTPTFFINGVFAGNVMRYEEFKSKIDAELKK